MLVQTEQALVERLHAVVLALGDDALDLGHGVVQPAIDDHMGAELASGVRFLVGFRQALGDELIGVTPTPQPLLLNRPGRCLQEDQDGVRHPFEDVAGALDVDLQHHIRAGLGLRIGTAVEVAKELRPLEKAVLGHMGLERVGIDERVGGVGLTQAWRARRPRPAQPQVRVPVDQAGDDGALTHSARPGDDDDHGRGRSISGAWLSWGRPSAATRAAEPRGRAPGGCR